MKDFAQYQIMLWGGGGINSHAEQANKRMCGWQSAPQQAVKAF